MASHSIEMSERKIALVAGFAFLVMTVAAIFAIMFVFGKIKVGGDIMATASNVLAHEMLFRTGFCSLILVLICDVVVSWALYIFLKQVNESVSLLAMLFRLIYAAILGAAMFNLSIAFNCAKDAIHFTALGTGPVHSPLLLFVDAFFDGWAVGLTAFGFHLLVLGYLVFKSGYIPRVIGILIVGGGLCYLVQNFSVFILPSYGDHKGTFDLILGFPMAIGELSLAFWLLFKGGKRPAGGKQ